MLMKAQKFSSVTLNVQSVSIPKGTPLLPKTPPPPIAREKLPMEINTHLEGFMI